MQEVQYLTYNDGTDTRYELVDGELVSISLGTGRHEAIIRYLSRQFELMRGSPHP